MAGVLVTRLALPAFLIYTSLITAAISQGAGLESSIQYRIDEGMSKDELLGNIIIDGNFNSRYSNSSALSQLRFQVVSRQGNTAAEGMFHLDEASSNLTTAKDIDRESICAYQPTCKVNLDIEVQPSQYFAIVRVTIEIKDINDNTPTFEEDTVSLTISEDIALGSTLALRTADDPDSPELGIQRYEQISDSSEFRLSYSTQTDAEEIYLILQRELDREVKSTLNIKIYAHDGGTPPKSSSVEVIIAVQDANDNSPEFDKTSYEVSLAEDLHLMSTVFKATASDPDEGDNGKILYRFSSRTEASFGDTFKINDTTGDIILISPLDYEAVTSYTLTIIADNASPGSTSTQAVLTINVIDVNDNAPVITIHDMQILDNGTAFTQLPESIDLGYFVAYISVSDKDSGQSGQVSCSLQGELLFALQKLGASDFKLMTISRLDRETLEKHLLTITCQDGGQPSQTSTQRVLVVLEDVNDNPPVFHQSSYITGLPLNSSARTWVMQVQASDADLGINADFSYRVISPVEVKVAIDPVSGNITLAGALDVNKDQNWLNFTVEAVDEGVPSLIGQAKVAIHILDKDELIPHFTHQVYAFRIMENLLPDSPIGQVKLANPIYPTFNPFTFAFSDTTRQDNRHFRIHEKSGQIWTRKALNREAKDTYNLEVRSSLTGSSISSVTKVTVEVNDENDNVPRFIFPSITNNTIYISQDTRAGQTIVRILAKDADLGDNGALTYSIFTGDPAEYFSINPLRGDLQLQQDLRSFRPQTFTLIVKVQDNGNPRLSEEATLNVILQHASEFSDKLPIYLGIAFGVGFVFLILIITVVVVMRKQKKTAKKCKKVERMLDEKMKSLESLENNNNTSQQGLPVLSRAGSTLGDLSQDSMEMEACASPGLIILEDSRRNSYCQNPNFGYLGDRDSDSGCSTDLSNTDSGKSTNFHGNHNHLGNPATNGNGYNARMCGRGSLWDTHIPEDGLYQEQPPFSRNQRLRMQTRAPVHRSLSASVAEQSSHNHQPQSEQAGESGGYRLSYPMGGKAATSLSSQDIRGLPPHNNGPAYINKAYLNNDVIVPRHQANSSLDSTDSEPVLKRPVFPRYGMRNGIRNINKVPPVAALEEPTPQVDDTPAPSASNLPRPHSFDFVPPGYHGYHNPLTVRFSDDENQRNKRIRHSDEESTGHKSDTAMMQSNWHKQPRRAHHAGKKRKLSQRDNGNGRIPDFTDLDKITLDLTPGGSDVYKTQEVQV